MEIYVVQLSDTIDSIAEKYGVLVEKIIYDNQLIHPYELAIGQALLISTGERSVEREAVVNGYAYPFINEWVLQQTLPYLTELSIFSYGFTPEGDLIPPMIDDTWMIEKAWKSQVLPILTLTPFGADGMFNNHLISAVVNNEEARQRLVDQLLETVVAKGFAGVDIDFEYILASDRDSFTAFVGLVSSTMNEKGYQVSVALAPKSSADQKGPLTEGKDYKGIGEAANAVLLMTYEWGYTYSAPMPVAPIYFARETVEYAITEIPKEKINLGIPNYGYDWALPYVKGTSKAKTIGNIEAVRIAIDNHVKIEYDEVAQSPHFQYQKNDVTHEVWFEDVRSIQAKFDLIEEFQLRGAGYWQIMQLFRANWLLLEHNFDIKK